MPPVSGKGASMGDFWLIPRGENGGMRLRLEPPGPITIGRAPGNTVTLPDRTVSRLHATLQWTEGDGSRRGHWRIADAGSQGGTLVNASRLQGGQSLPLESGDVIEIPPHAFEFVDRSRRDDSPATLPLEDREPSGVESIAPRGPRSLAQEHLLQVLESSE